MGGPPRAGDAPPGTRLPALTSKVCTGMLLALRERGCAGGAGVAELISCRALSAWGRAERGRELPAPCPAPPLARPPTPKLTFFSMLERKSFSTDSFSTRLSSSCSPLCGAVWKPRGVTAPGWRPQPPAPTTPTPPGMGRMTRTPPCHPSAVGTMGTVGTSACPRGPRGPAPLCPRALAPHLLQDFGDHGGALLVEHLGEDLQPRQHLVHLAAGRGWASAQRPSVCPPARPSPARGAHLCSRLQEVTRVLLRWGRLLAPALTASRSSV